MDDIEIVAVIYEISIAYIIGIYFGEEKTRQHSSLNRSHYYTIISDIAHSVQTPLTIAQAELELVCNETGEKDSIVVIRKSLVRIAEFVRRMVRLARIEGCTEPIHETFDFSALVQEETEYIASMGEQEGIVVTTSIEPGIGILGDRKGMVDVIINIAQNAIKYRRTDVTSMVHVALCTRSDCIELSFTDNGIGIDAKNIPYIFDRLYRASDLGEGFGLGLALVKKIVDIHQGTIEVESVVGEGSVFSIRFPKCKMPPCGDNIQKGSPQELS